MLVKNGTITAALQRLFAEQRSRGRCYRRSSSGSTRGRRRSSSARAAAQAASFSRARASPASRARGWPATEAALRAAAQTLNGAVKAVGARLEVVRETLTKRVDEVGEKVDDVGVEVGEVKAELKEVHDDTTHLRVQQDHIARGVRGLCGVVSELMHGSPPTRAADDLRRFTVESKPLEAPPPERTALETTAARLAEALAAVDAIGSA